MWDFFETVRHRHSVRKYRTEVDIEQEKIHAVLEMSCSAPSAGDLQSYRIIVVRDKALREQLAQDSGGQPFICEAPVCLIFCADVKRSEASFGERGSALFSLQDATIAASYAQLAAVAAGLASAWVGEFDETRVASSLSLSPELRPVAMIALGYPAELPEATPRRVLGEVVEFR